jgi:uracil-DNA glycosylase family 4
LTDPAFLLARYLRQRLELGETDLVFPNPLELDALPRSGEIEQQLQHFSRAASSRSSRKTGVRPATGIPRESIGPPGGPAIVPRFPGGSHQSNEADRGSSEPGAIARTSEVLILAEEVDERPGQPGEPLSRRAEGALAAFLTAVGISDRAVFLPLPRQYLAGGTGTDVTAADGLEMELRARFETLKPTVILTMGAHAAQLLLKSTEPIGKLRGAVHSYEEIPLVTSYGVAMLFQNAAYIRSLWDDLQRVRSIIDAAT